MLPIALTLTMPAAFVTPASVPLLANSRANRPICNLVQSRRSYSTVSHRVTGLIPWSCTLQSTSSSAGGSEVIPTADNSFHVTYTYLQNNAFALKYADATILVDPWLTGDLVFFTPKFYSASKKIVTDPETDPRRFDLSTISAVVLTQGLPDHAHIPTLQIIDRAVPIIATVDAVPIVHGLGFANVSVLEPGAWVAVPQFPNITVTGAKGSVVGPPWALPQLAVLFSFAAAVGDCVFRVYHEPHGNHDDSFLQSWANRLDAVIAPVVSAVIPVFGDYALVNGVDAAIALCKAAKPVACVTFDNSPGDSSGFLEPFIQSGGGFRKFLKAVADEPMLQDLIVIGEVEPMRDIIIAGEGVGALCDRSNW